MGFRHISGPFPGFTLILFLWLNGLVGDRFDLSYAGLPVWNSVPSNFTEMVGDCFFVDPSLFEMRFFGGSFAQPEMISYGLGRSRQVMGTDRPFFSFGYNF